MSISKGPKADLAGSGSNPMFSLAVRLWAHAVQWVLIDSCFGSFICMVPFTVVHRDATYKIPYLTMNQEPKH